MTRTRTAQFMSAATVAVAVGLAVFGAARPSGAHAFQVLVSAALCVGNSNATYNSNHEWTNSGASAGEVSCGYLDINDGSQSVKHGGVGNVFVDINEASLSNNIDAQACIHNFDSTSFACGTADHVPSTTVGATTITLSGSELTQWTGAGNADDYAFILVTIPGSSGSDLFGLTIT